MKYYDIINYTHVGVVESYPHNILTRALPVFVIYSSQSLNMDTMDTIKKANSNTNSCVRASRRR